MTSEVAKEALQPPSDNDRLIDTLKSGFSDLIKKQEELQKAVESLKPSAPTDKKTRFWTTYMKVADEHDKEFKEKYSTDLDVALIFAGLFSAVSSAFIIQIQPQLTPTAPTLVVAVQALLYTSLFTTLLAALLAVLGKQWVMHYQAAGSRGTIEERGLERQRKLDGLRQWKLDMVLQIFPLLLQFSLLLFWTGLSVYLWPTHRSVAGLVIGLTVLGVSCFILLLVSAIVFPDSPFQTPLSSFLDQVFSPILLTTLARLRRLIRRMQHSSLARFTKSRTSNLLPSFRPQASEFSAEQPLWTKHARRYISRTSAEAPAVVWLLETSTDPTTVTLAGELAADLQWPLNRDYTLATARLKEIFDSCFNQSYTRPTTLRRHMAPRALACGMGLMSLKLMTYTSDTTWSTMNFSEWGLEDNSEAIPD
ncbi:hypothetical protein DFH06DRAFT_1475136 [Mycena polygramma]|nr:hypothetical protein DFH06DRAFT_1475136 [Mycena polygramma]